MNAEQAVRLAPVLRSFNGPSLYAEDPLSQDARNDFLASLRQLAALPDDMEARGRLHTLTQHNAAGMFGSPDREDKPFAQVGDAAVIPISGTLLNRFGGSYGYVTGYNAIRAQLNAAMSDPSIRRIVLDVNSPGGMVAGCFELADDIRAARAQKPILALVDGGMCSAAYAIGSQATRIVAAPSARVGSIGVVIMHINIGPALEKEGIEVTFIHAGERKVDGNPFQALSKEAKADWQASVDAILTDFVAAVVAGRDGKISDKAIRDTQARVYSASDALALGLVDAVSTPQAAFAAFVQSGGPQQQERVDDMSDKTKADATTDAAALAAAAATARQEERTRFAAIIGHPEAAGRSKLAHHLATTTDMTVEAVAGILAVSAKEVAATPVQEPKKDPLAAAMDKTEQPNISGEGGGDDGPVARMLSAYSAATGVKIGDGGTKH